MRNSVRGTASWLVLFSTALLVAPAAGQIATLGEPAELRVASGRTQLTFPLPRQAVSLLVFALPH
ncbi:MAG TPA: hypothetical protein VFO82_15305 [Steroidobacteraceae bacterium]|nr:hypothetical protein [Steroidobacteraceae bacterium]